MFWLILLVVCIVLCVVGLIVRNGHDYWEDIAVTFFVIGFCDVIVILCVLFSGIFSYASLVEEKEKILVIQTRVVDIRNSSYKADSQGKLIAGSIENIKQSQVLSSYITELVRYEAEYNSRLKYYKVKKEETALWLFTDGFFISDKIYELKPITIENYNWKN